MKKFLNLIVLAGLLAALLFSAKPGLADPGSGEPPLKVFKIVLPIVSNSVGLSPNPIEPPASKPIIKGPYYESKVFAGTDFNFGTHDQAAGGSDIWPTTWGPDNNIYTSWGDGGGFGGSNSDGRVSLGFARIEGMPGSFAGHNVWGGKNAEHLATFGGKTAGILSVDGVLYAWINTQNGNPPDFKLAWSTNLGASWSLSDWNFPSSGTFFPSTFLQYGKDYAGARDGYVYSYGAKWTETQGPENNVYLMRAPKGSLRDRRAYEFFKGLDGSGKPTWSADINQRQPVFSDPNGVGNNGLAAVIYDAPVGRYLLTVGHRPPSGGYVSGTRGRLGIFDAAEPWGPWTTVSYYDNWGGYGDSGETLGYYIPTKWISSDGKTLWMVYSSTDPLDSFNYVKFTLNMR